jgi:phthalate 4,5-dioxygenase oxygenase subunit
VPSEPAESGYAKKIKLTSYPLVEKGGVIWTYMGKPENMPPEPNYEFCTVSRDQSFVSKRQQECNWLQALEGGIDSSHVSFLHRGDVKADPLFKGAEGNKYNLADLSPVFEVIESEGGLFIGARRMAEDDQYYWRITPWLMPCYTAVPPRGDYPMHGHFWVPVDDENCFAWSFDYHPVRPLTAAEVGHMKAGKGVHCKYVPGTYRPLANKDNDYLMDREAQRIGTTFSGVEGIAIQDASLQESMGPIVDRTKENLVGCDNGIIMARHKIMRAAKALREKGTLPPARNPEQQAVRATALLLKRDVHFKDGAKEALKACKGVPQTTV